MAGFFASSKAEKVEPEVEEKIAEMDIAEAQIEQQLASLLHRAVDMGNDQQLETALNGILGIIQENPLKDFAEFRKNMADPNFVLEV